MANVIKLAATLQHASMTQETVTQRLHQQHRHLQVCYPVRLADPSILTVPFTPWGAIDVLLPVCYACADCVRQLMSIAVTMQC